MRTSGRILVSLAHLIMVSLFLLPIATASAQETTRTAALDTLFDKLRVAPDPATASAIDGQIWFVWMHPTDPVLSQQMEQALRARSLGDLPAAIALLDGIIEQFPHYAEAWNQRATIRFMMGNYEASIADCAEVLEREPRHFGALAGRAIMYLQLGKRALALQDITTALRIHPFLNERHLFPELRQDTTRI